MTTIGLIRHGSTEWNRLGKLQGQLDTELTEEGIKQAELLGRRLAKEDWSGIVCSDLRRASETARIVSELSGIPLLRTDARLRERSFGLAEGTTLEERQERWGADWKKLDLGGETDAQVWERWVHFIEELTAAEPEGKILIISHGGFIVQVLRGLRMERDEFLNNTSLTVLQRKDSSWELLLYNCQAHLVSS